MRCGGRGLCGGGGGCWRGGAGTGTGTRAAGPAAAAAAGSSRGFPAAPAAGTAAAARPLGAAEKVSASSSSSSPRSPSESERERAGLRGEVFRVFFAGGRRRKRLSRKSTASKCPLFLARAVAFSRKQGASTGRAGRVLSISPPWLDYAAPDTEGWKKKRNILCLTPRRRRRCPCRRRCRQRRHLRALCFFGVDGCFFV